MAFIELPTDLFTQTALEAQLGDDGSGDLSDPLAELVTHAASDSVAKYIGHPITFVAGIVERVQGKNTPWLYLKQTPVTAINTVTINETALAATDFVEENLAAGLLWRRAGWPRDATQRNTITPARVPGYERFNVEVNYDGGWVTAPAAVLDVGLTRSLPFDIEMAALNVAVTIRNGIGRSKDVTTESAEGGQRSYSQVVALSASVRAVLNQYRRARFA